MKCLIVDDNEMSRVALESLCRHIDYLDVVALCDDAASAMEILEKQAIDLLLLDIEMPTITGLDLVRTLEPIPLVIFTTSKKEYAVEAFEMKEWVVDYLTKPIKLPRLKKAVDQAWALFKKAEPITKSIQAQDYIFVRSSGKLVRIDMNDLEYIETVGDYVRFQTSQKAHLVHGTIKSIEVRIQHPDLLKVNRSYIVNLSKIKDIEDHSILIGDKIIPVSRAHRSTLLKRINPL